jgi:hypothetical protein
MVTVKCRKVSSSSQHIPSSSLMVTVTSFSS